MTDVIGTSGDGKRPYTFEAQGLTKAYRGRRVVKGVSLTLHAGEIVGLLGPNGAGKTTVFDMMVGLTLPDEGAILLGDEAITDLPMYQRARRGIGYLPQESSVFRRMTVEQNLV
ncbi:MAG TPA: ATP-binding cassette domain-containing protein, partial [Nitrospirales bacterium]|nr:ATP-binding cassette domain-containing protein [Nitrospirales bacterium]